MRRYFHNSATSFFRFEAEDILESAPTRVDDCSGKMAVLEHVRDPEVFDGDEGAPINIPPRRLVRVVLALADDLEVLLRRLTRRLTSAVGAFLAPTRLALRPATFLLRAPEAARVLNHASIRVGDEVLEANVQADGISVPLLRGIS
jgi:hypothetical protein